MQALVRAISACVLLLPALVAQPAFPQERNVVITRGADYFGADYDVRQDIDLDACQAACLGDQQCQVTGGAPDFRQSFTLCGVAGDRLCGSRSA